MIHSCVFLWLVVSGDAFYTGDEWDAMICGLACVPVLSARYSPDMIVTDVMRLSHHCVLGKVIPSNKICASARNVAHPKQGWSVQPFWLAL